MPRTYVRLISRVESEKVTQFIAIFDEIYERVGSVERCAAVLGVSKGVLNNLKDKQFLTDKQAMRIRQRYDHYKRIGGAQ